MVKNKHKSLAQKNSHKRIGADHKPEDIVFSFKFFDKKLGGKGQTFEQWENEKLLHLMFERLVEYSQKTIPVVVSRRHADLDYLADLIHERPVYNASIIISRD